MSDRIETYRTEPADIEAYAGPATLGQRMKAFFVERMLKSKNPLVSLPSMFIMGVIGIGELLLYTEGGQIISFVLAFLLFGAGPVVLTTFLSPWWALAYPLYAIIGLTLLGRHKAKQLKLSE